MISEALRLIRVFHDMKQNEAAEALGLSKSYVSELENGHKAPSMEVIEKYSEVFSIPPSSILFFSESIGRDNADQSIKNAIADKVISFLKLIESRTGEKA